MTREELKERETQFWNKYYGSLKGATIVSFEGVQDFGDDSLYEGFPVFIVRFADGSLREIAISQDAEMNGGGFIAGLPDDTLD